jgi:hypothetical protein
MQRRAVCIICETDHLQTTCIANGITLLVTQSHWDTPQALEHRHLGLLDPEKYIPGLPALPACDIRDCALNAWSTE